MENPEAVPNFGAGAGAEGDGRNDGNGERRPQRMELKIGNTTVVITIEILLDFFRARCLLDNYL